MSSAFNPPISMHSILPKDHGVVAAALTEGVRCEDAHSAARRIRVAAGAVVAVRSDMSAADLGAAAQVAAAVVQSLQACCSPLATVAGDDGDAAAVENFGAPRRY